jgi:hypothetical protein
MSGSAHGGRPFFGPFRPIRARPSRPKVGDKRTRSGHHRNDADDPKRTPAPQIDALQEAYSITRSATAGGVGGIFKPGVLAAYPPR